MIMDKSYREHQTVVHALLPKSSSGALRTELSWVHDNEGECPHLSKMLEGKICGMRWGRIQGSKASL